jgi:hypothetical protein
MNDEVAKILKETVAPNGGAIAELSWMWLMKTTKNGFNSSSRIEQSAS